jgi:hypothetical protein
MYPMMYFRESRLLVRYNKGLLYSVRLDYVFTPLLNEGI